MEKMSTEFFNGVPYTIEYDSAQSVWNQHTKVITYVITTKEGHVPSARKAIATIMQQNICGENHMTIWSFDQWLHNVKKDPSKDVIEHPYYGFYKDEITEKYIYRYVQPHK